MKLDYQITRLSSGAITRGVGPRRPKSVMAGHSYMRSQPGSEAVELICGSNTTRGRTFLMTPSESNSQAEDRLLAPTPRRGAPRRDHLSRPDRPARFLDPEGAVRFEEQQLAPTAYAGDQLLLRPTGDDDRVVEMLTQAADELDYDAELEPVDQSLVELAEEAGILRGGDQPLVVRVRLHRRYGERALPAADAWPVLQRYRELAGNDPTTSRRPAGTPADDGRQGHQTSSIRPAGGECQPVRGAWVRRESLRRACVRREPVRRACVRREPVRRPSLRCPWGV